MDVDESEVRRIDRYVCPTCVKSTGQLPTLLPVEDNDDNESNTFSWLDEQHEESIVVVRIITLHIIPLRKHLNTVYYHNNNSGLTRVKTILYTGSTK